MSRLGLFLITTLLFIGSTLADLSSVTHRAHKRDNLNTGGIATRYWDCCKPSGAWPNKAAVNRPVYTCAIDGVTRLTDPNTRNSCEGGAAYSCVNYKPFVSSTNNKLSYAFGARAQSNDESTFECTCYAVQFNQLQGKTLVVQATNTGGDVPATNFDIQIPGGGVGYYSSCSAQYNAPPDGWGQRYGGVSNINDCNALPASIRDGCQWRFNWFADNPTISAIRRVRCPTVLTSKSGCIRNDDGNYPVAPV